MSAEYSLPLHGLYRVQNTAPGFAICLFKQEDGTICVQQVGNDGRITGFLTANIDGSFVFDPPPRGDGEPWSVRIGQSMLYAFHRPDGSFTIGSREEVIPVVREELPNLRALPFLWEEAAGFVGDEKQVGQARTLTGNLLRHPTWGRQKIGDFSAGDSTPKRRTSAEAIRLDEKFHVEEPLLEHLEKLGWTVIRLEMHQQTPGDTGRKDFSQVVLENRLTQGGAGSPNDQARLTTGMCSHRNLLSLLQSFILFTTDSRGNTYKVVARYQQFRAVHKALERMTNGETPAQRGGIIWHTQGSGKSLTMVFMVRELRRRIALLDWKVVFVTDRRQLEDQLSETSLSIGQTVRTAESISSLQELLRDPSSNCVMAMVQKFQERDLQAIFPVLNMSPKIVVMIDEAHRTQYGLLKANLERALPFATNIAYTGTPLDKTERTFGGYIDYYTMRQAQEDGVTLEIVYEGRTHSAGVSDSKAMDTRFQDVFSEYRISERLRILGYGARDAYLDAKATIGAKARDMVRHYARQVFPGGYKAQVVANSRTAAVRYAEALRGAIVEEVKSLAEDNPLQVKAEELRQVEVALVITWGNNDDVEIKDAMKNVDCDLLVKRFKMPFDAVDETGADKVNGRIGIVVVNEMLITGFDAPVEQVLYLDRVIKDHNLLQAIARVNRVYDDGKDCGFMVDYVGVGNDLRKALDAYAQREQQEVIECLVPASELIGELKFALGETLQILARNGLSETTETEAFYDLFYDEDIRFEYLTSFRKLTHALSKALPRAEALDYLKDYQRLSAVNELASQFLKDNRLSMKGIPKKLREITDQYLVSQGIEQKIAPISVLDPDFQKQAEQRNRAKTKAAAVEYAIRHHIEVNFDEDSELFASFSKELERILQDFAGNWDAIWKEMEKLRQKLIAKEQEETHGLDRKRGMRIFRIIRAELFGEEALDEDQIAKLVNITQLVFQEVQTESRQAGFWEAPLKQARLRGELQRVLLGPDYVGFGPMWEKQAAIVSRIMEWSRQNRKLVIRP